ncbi:27069_t:CDS:2, partial [Dentiscutata erythropus]
MGIKKNRETQIITIRDIPISYQDITTDMQKANLSHQFYDRNPDRTLNLTIKKERSHASYLARKTSDPGKSEKNLLLAPNVGSKNLSLNNVLNKTTLILENKTNRTPNNQLHVDNMILEKTVKPNIPKKKKTKPPLERKPKQEFSKENIKQNESTEKWVDKQYDPKKCKRFIIYLLPESFPKQVKKLKELVKENKNRVKLIEVTTDDRWDEI